MYDKNTNINISIFFFANKKYEFSTFFDNLQLFRKKGQIFCYQKNNGLCTFGPDFFLNTKIN